MLGTIARLDHVTLHYGAQTLFEDLTGEIFHDARIGLVGPNAAGKSSLMRILAHDLESSSGSAVLARGIRVGYLHQEVIFEKDRTVLEEARDASPTLANLELQLEKLSERMGDPIVYGDARKLQHVTAEYEKRIAEFEEKGGLNFENRVRSTLIGLGFEESDFHLSLAALSGGQKKMVELAKLLIEQPELLLLDEPDNHLDLRGKRFLEEWISDYPGAVVIVSHDRYLLDVVAEEILELEDGRLTRYPGNYTEYVLTKEQKLDLQARQYGLQQRIVRRMELAIQRLLGWGAGQNEKLVKRGRSMQKRLDKMDKVDAPPGERRAIGLAFSPSRRGSERTLEVSNLSKAYGATEVLRDVSFQVWNSERVGIIGPNGSGKTVLLKCIQGVETADSGSVRLGPSNTIGFYSQEHQTLDFSGTLADELTKAKPMGNRELFGLLGRFLFTAADAEKKVANLSGGEKARVQMARLMLGGANFLLLDEPTNHLDIRSAEMLEEALEDFDGTLLAVSHDRYFLDNVAQRILELEGGTVREYAGNYTVYQEAKRREASAAAAAILRSSAVSLQKKASGKKSAPSGVKRKRA